MALRRRKEESITPALPVLQAVLHVYGVWPGGCSCHLAAIPTTGGYHCDRSGQWAVSECAATRGRLAQRPSHAWLRFAGLVNITVVAVNV